MTSHHPTPATALSTSTRKSPISSTISRTSGMLPLHPYHCTPPPPTKGNEKQSLSFSRKSVPTPRHSDSSSRWPTTTLLSSTHSSRTHQSTVTSTGENSTGGQCCNGNNCRRRRDPPLATQSVSHSSHPTAYNPHTNESDYDDNKTPDIVDLYSEEVYNNID